MENKLVKIGFSIFALTAIVFGFASLSNSIHLTFNTDGAEPAVTGEELLEETKQKITDTDTDGLSDWAELNTYGTSPYLADSDSDGLVDSEELKAGTDPNCPTGKDCGSGELSNPSVGVGEAEVLPDSVITDGLLSAEDLNSLTADDIRELLKQGGATEEDLQGVSDGDLKVLLQEVASGQETAQ